MGTILEIKFKGSANMKNPVLTLSNSDIEEIVLTYLRNRVHGEVELVYYDEGINVYVKDGNK